jgi:hypothetical protein
MSEPYRTVYMEMLYNKAKLLSLKQKPGIYTTDEGFIELGAIQSYSKVDSLYQKYGQFTNTEAI